MKSEVRLQLLEKFVAASRQGNHLFIIVPNSHEWLKNRQLPEHIKSHITTLHEKNSFQSYGQFMSEHTHLEIRYGTSGPKLIDSTKWIIGHEEVMNGKYLERSRLLVENEENDGKLYELVLNNESTRPGSLMKRYKFALNYETIGGSGRKIVNKFSQLICDKKIVCCICDSDKLAPNDKPGDTYQKVDSCAKNMNIKKNFVGLITFTPCHESENFLNSYFIIEMLKDEISELEKNEPKYRQKIKKLNRQLKNLDVATKNINKQGDPAKRTLLWLYLDIKMGINKNNEKINEISNEVKQWLTSGYNVEKFDKINIPEISDELIKLLVKNRKFQGKFHQHIKAQNKDWTSNFSPWIDEFILYLIGQDIDAYEEVS